MKKLIQSFSVTLLCLAALLPDTLGHGHIDAGTTIDGTQLYLYNVYNLQTIPTPTYQDYLNNGGGQTQARIESVLNAGYNYIFEVTFTAMGSTTPVIGIPDGSFIQLQLVGFSGPGNFAFWESTPQTAPPAWSINTGYDFVNDPAILIDLTAATWTNQSAFGHRHNRRYAVDQAGLYTLEWQVIDREGLFAPSQSFFMQLHAIPEPATLGLLGGLGALALIALRRRKIG
jgi:hypothetical protein